MKRYSSVWFALFICSLGGVFYFYEYYLRVAPSVMRPELKQVYQLSEAGFGFLVALYYWAYVPIQLPVGIIMDHFGPRKVLTFACALCSLGTYMFCATDILWIASIGRLLIGLGSAFSYVGVLKLSNIWLPKKFFALMAGSCTTLGMLGAISGAIVIGKFNHIIGWQYTLYSSAIVGFLLTIVLWFFIKDSKKEESYELLKDSNFSWPRELLQIIKIPDLWLSGIVGCMMFSVLSIFAETWSISFLTTLGLSDEQAAFATSLVFFGFGSGAPLAGMLSEYYNDRKKLLFWGSLMSAIMISLVIYLSLPYWLLCGILFLLGLTASTEVLVFAVANDVCVKEVAATAIGFVNTLVMVGGLVLQPLVGILLDSLTSHNEVARFRLSLCMLPIGFIISAILANYLQSPNGSKDRD